MFKINNKNNRMTSTSFWCFYCYRWTNFTPFYGVSIVDSEQVNLSWVWIYEINSFPDTSSVIKQKGVNLKTGVSRNKARQMYPLYAVQVRQLNTYKIICPFALLPTAYCFKNYQNFVGFLTKQNEY